MFTQQEIINETKTILEAEADAIKQLIPQIDAGFADAINAVMKIKGRTIVTGMGKPGYIARKLAATLMSTGTPAMFLHPAEATHGDLGMVTSDDIIIAISNSGETQELIDLLPAIHKIGVPVIAICGNKSSTLGQLSQYFITSHVIREICPLNLAPTTSTTVQLALCDAFAIILMKQKKFASNDFAFYHPGGSLGKIRLLTAKKIIEKTKKNPQINPNEYISDALFIMTESGVGAACVVDTNSSLLGIITDGDIRRSLKNNGSNLLNQKIADVMTLNPVVLHENEYVSKALILMQNHYPNPITVLPIIDNNRIVKGVIHITDLL